MISISLNLNSLSKAISHNFILNKVIQNKTLFVNILFNNWDYKLRKKIAVKEKMNQIHRELTVLCLNIILSKLLLFFIFFKRVI
jgi:hypothetical protein